MLQQIPSRMDTLIEECYLLASLDATPPFLSDIIEKAFWITFENKLFENLDEAAELGEHELYNMSMDEFKNWFYRHEYVGRNYEPKIEINDIILQVETYIHTYQLFVNPVEKSFFYTPLQEVW